MPFSEFVFTDYTAAAVGITFVVSLLVGIMLGGGILMVNIAMMSKRLEDQVIGDRREPGDVAILQESTWPPEAKSRAVFPAQEPDQGIEASPMLRQEEVPLSEEELREEELRKKPKHVA